MYLPYVANYQQGIPCEFWIFQKSLIRKSKWAIELFSLYLHFNRLLHSLWCHRWCHHHTAIRLKTVWEICPVLFHPQTRCQVVHWRICRSWGTQYNKTICIAINVNYFVHRLENIEKSEQDNRDYRGLQLENGLKVLLVSDPTTDVSAAALAVQVGYVGKSLKS